ncbi:MAG: LemA family protein [bacterium]|nr:LemA family protein [bacterium]
MNKFKSNQRGALKGWIIFIVILVLLLFALIWLKNTYNQLVTMDETLKNAWAQVENQLQRRYDLIPNLVETVKGFAEQEKTVLLGVTEARAKVAGAQNPEQRMNAENQLSGALSRLLVVVENYPQLKSDQNFIRLQDELAGTENRIAVERMRYNDAVKNFNTLVRRFPTNVIASLFNFSVKQTFEAPAEAKAAPKVKF